MSTEVRGYVVTSDGGVSWDMEPDRPAVFKLLSETTGERVAVFEETVPPGAGTPLHTHRTSDEIIYIIAGTFTFRLGQDQSELGPGAWVFIPRSSVHGWRNTGMTSGRVACIFLPGADAKAFEEMRLQGMPIPQIDPAIRDGIFERHGYQFVTWEW